MVIYLTECHLCSENTMRNQIKCVPGQISSSDKSKWEWSVIHQLPTFQQTIIWPLNYSFNLHQEIKVKGSMHHVPQRQRKESEQDQ